MKSVLLLISVAFNIALIYGLISYSGQSDQDTHAGLSSVICDVQSGGPELVPVRKDPGIAQLAAVDFSTDDRYELLDQLQLQGLPDEFIKRIMLASINMDLSALQRQQESDRKYWKSTKNDSAQQIRQELVLAAEKRVLLRQLFGDAVEDDPIFEDLFRPYNDTLEFLSSDKQIALYEKLELNQAKSRDMFGPGFIREQMQDRRAMQQEMLASIQELLTPEEYFEYELRESGTAKMMRQSMVGFDYTEQEFRDIYKIRDNFQQVTRTPLMTMRDSQSREEIRVARDDRDRRLVEYLGDERFEELKRLQDPVYQSLVTIGDRYGSTEASIISAYEVTREFRNRITEMRSDRSLSGEERRSQMDKLSAESLAEIEDLVGEDVANSIRNNTFWGRRRGLKR